MGLGRRALLQGLSAAALLPSGIPVQAQPAGGKILIKGGHVATVNRSIGELVSGDVLVDGTTIAAIGENLSAPGAEIIDARAKLVLPGLIDTHRHTWETVTRSLI